MKDLLERTFALPPGDPRYAHNALTPGAAPFEPSYSELQPGALRFNIQPLGPEASGMDRRDESIAALRESVRREPRSVQSRFIPEALAGASRAELRLLNPVSVTGPVLEAFQRLVSTDFEHFEHRSAP